MNRYRMLPSYRYYEAEGQSVSLSNPAGKPLRDYRIYGNTVDGVSCGDKTKNLLKLDDAEQIINGVTVRVDKATQQITAVGTPTNNGGRLYALAEITLEAGDYYFSASSETPRAALSNKSDGTLIAWSNRTFTLTEETTAILGVNLVSGTEYNDSITLQLEAGSAATEYEPYGYKIPVVLRGINQCPVYTADFYTATTLNGVTLDVDERGRIMLNGTCTASANFQTKSVIFPAGKYSLCDFAEGVFTSSGYFRVQLLTPSGTYIKGTYDTYDSKQVANFELAEDTAICFRVRITGGHTYNNCVLKPMIISGTYNSATIPKHEPYIEPSVTDIYIDESLASGEYLDFRADNLPKIPTEKYYTNVVEVDTEIPPGNIWVQYYK